MQTKNLQKLLLIISTITIFSIILYSNNCLKSSLNSPPPQTTSFSSNTVISEDTDILKNINLDPKIYSEYYIEKVTTYVNSYREQGKIVFLGDSLTDIGQWNELLDNPDILNRGISSDTTSGALNRLSEITKLKPRKIFIMLGINDIDKGLSIEEIIKNYSRIIQNIKTDSPSTSIYVESVLPINKDIYKTKTKDNQIINLNASLNNLCKNSNIQYINLYPLFTLPNQNKLYKEYTIGGLHVNGKGYKVWRDAIKSYL
ncbi:MULTISPECIES: GDSL-type esterase/lipase family protein [Clostridium]|uniref:Multifunctional acyl-CoA thioesterase I and protease I and lysophospholipase L1 n=4 Tax=Clostridium TaxID=1485 RepID=D8GPJ9_CLOLD|nr:MULTISPECIES: GDSL-type esterase/lipase family protein [Clostridium]ADK13908.1 putative SGNH hydrolase [Clostridium ljungdahlii DSM 13528]AGY77139.1 GDSL-type esterase/lipase family protein [Clostridium autoethanogenum DSM 10061]ALU37280.1 GDSL-like Lipase/Acylhydrolase family [Clostridium autoethanogenum DSM 10061]OAA87398.1 multifunctional acyl-CoA thioesterase I and protease I and lysophospholipase L1 [Clostridium ljungdahlii DSM 13528]OAA92453.1 multifunctional acyl-CoA thioesterase I a